MSDDLTSLFSLLPINAEKSVQKTCDRTGPILRKALRSECRLVMRTPEETNRKLPGARVPVKVEHGYPSDLEYVKMRLPPDFFRLLSEYRAALRNVEDGTKKLMHLARDPPSAVKQHVIEPTTIQGMEDTLKFCQQCLFMLDRNDPIQEILKGESDALGVYEIDCHNPTPRDLRSEAAPLRGGKEPNQARIRIFWQVIGFVATCRSWSIENLTIVVLAHELAHAYTQLGADIDGRRWSPIGFKETEVDLKEGLAQYFTKRVLARLPPPLEEPSKLFEELLEHQPARYRLHEDWEEVDPEAVRSAMLQVRRKGSCPLEMFETCLAQAQHQLVHMGAGSA